MRILRPFLLLLLFSIPLLSHGEENCLWMNAATAGGILGGPVTLSVTRTAPTSAAMQPANATSSYGPMSANASGTSYGPYTVDDSDCVFGRQPTTAGGLRISVRTVTEPHAAYTSAAAECGARGVPLKAIGNEAMICEMKAKKGQHSELMVGRIRDRLFTIHLDTAEPKLNVDALHEKARTTAEIVAGNLF